MIIESKENLSSGKRQAAFRRECLIGRFIAGLAIYIAAFCSIETLVLAELSGLAVVTSGGTHNCALTTSGGVLCWGSNDNGRLGDGTTTKRKIAVQVIGFTTGASSVVSGGAHTCALTTAGGVKCWGYNGNGQLGDGSTTQRTTAVDVNSLTTGVQSIAIGDSHSCAILTTGEVKCWGRNNNGQIGDGTTTQRATPVTVTGLSSGISTVTAGYRFTCAITTSGGLKCWGSNSMGQLGDGTTTQSTTPVDVVGMSSNISAVMAGSEHACAVSSTGGLKCWGRNDYGQLGDNSTAQSSIPVDVTGLTSGTSAVSTGFNHTCALTTVGGVMCWGRSSNGEVGDGETTHRSTPTNVTGWSSGAVSISAGGSFSCLVTSAGGIRCWGWNVSGTLGDGTTTDRTTAINVAGLSSGVSLVTGGDYHTCAVTDAGGVKCWGDNGQGELGDGTYLMRSSPANVVGLTSPITAASAGSLHTCALTSGGGVQCWGNNAYGQLGTGNTTNQNSAVDVSGLTSGMIAIALGVYHSCALSVSGGVKCWGRNNAGQLGDGSITQSNVPVDVFGLTSGIESVSAGYSYTCAVTTAGGAKCWGTNRNGYGNENRNSNRHRAPLCWQRLERQLELLNQIGS